LGLTIGPAKRQDAAMSAPRTTATAASPRDGQRADFAPKDTVELKERWRVYVAAKKLNVTSQREAIVEFFLRTREHVSIDELLAKVRKKHPKVGYATVYRTLKLLEDGGLAVERQFGDGQARYEIVGDHHDHLICTQCGFILEFEDHEIEDLQEKIAQKLGGFVVLRHRHELYGLCPRAQGVSDGYCPQQESTIKPAARKH
jgi:Fur family transcriptional regulator, ferric uptake regulator